ncbi:MAG: putative rane protein, partial [Sediminibacterium sp.]|nr:putative rane protein [Sediminibacterium sp.]
MKKGIWILLVISCILIGLYPTIYFIMDGNFGLRSSKSAELLANAIWNIGFYAHITLGSIALLTGWTQFGSKFRSRNLALHRRIGKVYVIAVL